MRALPRPSPVSGFFVALGFAVLLRARATASSTPEAAAPSATYPSKGTLIRHEVDISYDGPDRAEERREQPDEFNFSEQQEKPNFERREEFLASSGPGDTASTSSVWAADAEVWGPAGRERELREKEEQTPRRSAPEPRQKRRPPEPPPDVHLPATRSNGGRARDNSDYTQRPYRTASSKKTEIAQQPPSNQKTLKRSRTKSVLGPAIERAHDPDESIVELRSSRRTQNSCRADEEYSGIGRPIGYDRLCTYTGDWRYNCEQKASAAGSLKSDGAGASTDSDPVDFDEYVPSTSDPPAGACQYQGVFEYSTGNGRATCRRACDRVEHCTYFVHGAGGEKEYCMLFNACLVEAPTGSDMHKKWKADTAGAIATVYECKSGADCSADYGTAADCEGWESKSESGGATVFCADPVFCTREECCTDPETAGTARNRSSTSGTTDPSAPPDSTRIELIQLLIVAAGLCVAGGAWYWFRNYGGNGAEIPLPGAGGENAGRATGG